MEVEKWRSKYECQVVITAKRIIWNQTPDTLADIIQLSLVMAHQKTILTRSRYVDISNIGFRLSKHFHFMNKT